MVSVFVMGLFPPARQTTSVKSAFISAQTITSPYPLITGAPNASPSISTTPSLTPSPTQEDELKIEEIISPTIIPIFTVKPTITKLTATSTVIPSIHVRANDYSPLPTPLPTITPKPTATPTQVPPTQTPFPTFPPIINNDVTLMPSLNADLIFGLVNKHRTDIGLPALIKDEKTCNIAKLRAPQIYDELFVTFKYHSGFYALNLPYWSTENIIYYDTEQGAVDWWLNDPGHRRVIEGDYKYSCVACYGNACSQIFTSYIPK